MNQPITPYPYTLTNFFQGDYLTLYYNIGGGDGYMGMVFELFDLAA
jgi:hypothetical protein